MRRCATCKISAPLHARLTELFQGDQRLPHDSGKLVDPEYLSNLGILHYNFSSIDDVNRIAKDRDYKNRDEITISPSTLGDAYESKVKTFFHEHLHEDEEIRYIMDGNGYFDVRSKDDAWVRILLEKGDVRALPVTFGSC
ncbi:hypothetical protein FH972_023641 [Carpinus fangiana]|uniref:acireductone dioxygenase (Fe(2+)-requiring) n=1 Tax=Carpinus fangiana TaxID=176857 RepID=A0A5N6KW59_9ROSI|nr:hypothetical protein FH972_023641 [Carpinus fangiana]